MPIVTVKTTTVVNGGQTLGALEDGRKLFIWGALPNETVRVQVTKQKTHYLEGIAIDVLSSSPQRIQPKDSESYLSTSPWQIVNFNDEQLYKAQLVQESFAMYHLELPQATTIFTDDISYGYRNKIEYSFWYDVEAHTLQLAFFRRGSHGKIAIENTSLARPSINQTANRVLAALNKLSIGGRDLKTLLVRSDQHDTISWQLYVKTVGFPVKQLLQLLETSGSRGEIIYSNPKSPASVVTKRLTNKSYSLADTINGVPFHYAVESFFQINLPVYEQALKDIKSWVTATTNVVDLYSGVGTIGLTLSAQHVTLVEINAAAVSEMRQNIINLHKEATSTAVLAPSESALDYITSQATIIVDPPRAGLHQNVIDKLLETLPPRIIYLSCNPVTQARDISKLISAYTLIANRGYNFFPRTPHIEHLVILERQL